MKILKKMIRIDFWQFSWQHWQIFKNLQDRYFMKFPRVLNSDQTNNFRIPCTGEDLTFLKISFWSLFWNFFFGTLVFLMIGLCFLFCKRGWSKELYCGNLSFHVSYEIYFNENKIRIIFAIFLSRVNWGKTSLDCSSWFFCFAFFLLN